MYRKVQVFFLSSLFFYQCGLHSVHPPPPLSEAGGGGGGRFGQFADLRGVWQERGGLDTPMHTIVYNESLYYCNSFKSHIWENSGF